MDKNHRTYVALLSAQCMRSTSTFTFWMCAYLSVKHQGLPDASIVPCFLVLPIVSLLTDLPTGVFADRVSCKAAIQLSGLADSLAFICLGLVSYNSWFAPIALLFKGIGSSFENGAGGQLLFSSAKILYGETRGNRRSAIHSEISNRIGSVLGGGIGALFVHSHPTAIWVLPVLTTAINIAIISKLNEHTHLQKRFPSVREAALSIKSNLALSITLVFAPIFAFKIADGFRTGTEGVTFVPYITSLFEDPQALVSLPIIATVVRLPIVALMWNRRIPEPKETSLASCSVFFVIGCMICVIASSSSPIIAVAVATVNFGLYSLRDIWSRQWENQMALKVGDSAVTFRSALSTATTASQLLGTAALSVLGGNFDTKSFGLYLGGGAIIIAMLVNSVLVQGFRRLSRTT